MLPAQNKTPLNPSEGWRFDYRRDPGYSEAYLQSDQQSDNYFYYNEPCYKELKDNAYRKLTGLEPLYGHSTFPLNRLDQQQTNWRGRELQFQTQIETQGAPHRQNPVPTMVNQPNMYPWLKGRPWYTINLNGISGQ